MSRRVTRVRHISREELEARCRKEKDARVKERALAILQVYDGSTEEDATGSNHSLRQKVYRVNILRHQELWGLSSKITI